MISTAIPSPWPAPTSVPGAAESAPLQWRVGRPTAFAPARVLRAVALLRVVLPGIGLGFTRSWVEIGGQGRRMHVGRGLRPERRMALARELRRALRRECIRPVVPQTHLEQQR